METDLSDFISKLILPEPGKKLLLAVSGGLDSMVMWHVLTSQGIDCAVAHCNFRLRGKDSEEDARFVAQKAASEGIPLYVRHFHTRQYAQRHGLSIQMAARELRYAWFENLAVAHGFEHIATGHHADDQIETVFVNLIRGTGLKGLQGFPAKQGRLIRPLAFISRSLIASYARHYGLSFREDHSNEENHYLRNKIRNQLLPLLEEIYPGFRKVMHHNILRFRDEALLLQHYLASEFAAFATDDKTGVRINLERLAAREQAWYLLLDLLEPYGFNRDNLPDIAMLQRLQSGKQVYSPTHRIIRDRDALLLAPRATEGRELTIPLTLPARHRKMIRKKVLPFVLQMEIIDNAGAGLPDPSPLVASLDLDKLSAPLCLRNWHQGDAFRPFGLNRRKKLSDFLINLKLPLTVKENIWVLCSGEKIVWVVGYRIDHAFRITRSTRKILKISLLNI